MSSPEDLQQILCRRIFCANRHDLDVLIQFTRFMEKGVLRMEETKEDLQELAQDLQAALDRVSRILADLEARTRL